MKNVGSLLKRHPERELVVLGVMIVASVLVQVTAEFSPAFRFHAHLIPKGVSAALLLLLLRVAVGGIGVAVSRGNNAEPRDRFEEIVTLSSGGELLLRGTVFGAITLISPTLAYLTNFVLSAGLEGGLHRSWSRAVVGGVTGTFLGILYSEYRSLFLVSLASLLSLIFYRLYQGSKVEDKIQTVLRQSASKLGKLKGRYGRKTPRNI